MDSRPIFTQQVFGSILDLGESHNNSLILPNSQKNEISSQTLQLLIFFLKEKKTHIIEPLIAYNRHLVLRFRSISLHM